MKIRKSVIALLMTSLLLCLVLGCSQDGGREDELFIEGVYQTESQTGSFVRYTFSKDGSYDCDIYMLNVLTGQRSGSYTLTESEISLLAEGADAPDTFPFELAEDNIIINGTLYIKIS